MSLADRIDARERVVLARKATAEAATGGEWVWGADAWGGVELVSPATIPGVEPPFNVAHPWNVLKVPKDAWLPTEADKAHIAANDPATVIADCDRELAGIAADRELLATCQEWIERRATYEAEGHPFPVIHAYLAEDYIFPVLNARYPETEDE